MVGSPPLRIIGTSDEHDAQIGDPRAGDHIHLRGSKRAAG